MFKTLALLLTLAAIFAPKPAHSADYVGIEAGTGIHWLDGASILNLRLRRDTDTRLFSQPTYVEAFATYWDQRYDNSGIGGLFGIRPSWGRVHGVFGTGVTYLAHTNGISGTHGEFVIRLGAGYRVGQLDYTLVYNHYSNAKPVFDWQGPNAGYDFLLMQVSWGVR